MPVITRVFTIDNPSWVTVPPLRRNRQYEFAWRYCANRLTQGGIRQIRQTMNEAAPYIAVVPGEILGHFSTLNDAKCAIETYVQLLALGGLAKSERRNAR